MSGQLESLTERRLRTALLDRQLLLARSTGSLTAALSAIGGIQDQYAPSAYIRLWSCLAHFRRSDLDAALESRAVIQATLMRQTIHLVAAADYWPMAIATRRHRREWFARVQARAIGDTDMRAVADATRRLLADGPMQARQLADRLASLGHRPEAARWVGEWLDLVRVPPSGTWTRRRADLYGLASDWVGPEPELTEADALRWLAERYLRAFGPATVGDAATWAGVPLAAMRSAVSELAVVERRGPAGQLLLDLPDAPLPDEGAPAPVRFLPTWDATLLVHARRTQVLREEHRPLVFNTRTPHSVPTFLVDGQVAGTWRHVDDRIEAEPFERLPRRAMAQLDEEAVRLAAFHA